MLVFARPLRLTCVILATLRISGLLWAGDGPRSGLQPGDTAGAFNVQDVTGPRRGKSLCYACAFGKHAVVNIQARAMSPSLIELIQKLDALVDSPTSIQGESQHAFVVYITDDPDSATRELGEIARQHKIQNIPFTVFDELTGPRGYKLAPDAEVTVMMWKDTVVAVNHAAASSDMPRSLVDRILQDARRHLSRGSNGEE